MRKILILILIVSQSIGLVSANSHNDTIADKKAFFHVAQQEIADMLSGKQSLDYERAVFVIENAWYENKISYSDFQNTLDFYQKAASFLMRKNSHIEQQTFKATLLKSVEEQKEDYRKALANWAIYHLITDTTYFFQGNVGFVFLPMQYSVTDPYATDNWKNSQVTHLIAGGGNGGNCYALTSLFKILSLRLNTDATLVTTPNHIFIEHADPTGAKYNVELASRAFPGTGSLQTLTYTTEQAIKSGIAFRNLSTKQSIALSLVYLAKGYEQKFHIKDDAFVLSCAGLALQHDSLNLNAMLLKTEVLEERVTKKNKSLSLLQKDKDFQYYQNYIAQLYQLGYRAMPVAMKNILLSNMRKDTVPMIVQNHTPQPFGSTGMPTNRYATLSGGLFEEVHKTKPFEKYNRTIFNTETQTISAFAQADVLYNNYNFDLVVFALSIDPLAGKFPSESPYVFVGDNPVSMIDDDGRKKTWYIIKIAEDGSQTKIKIVEKYKVIQYTETTRESVGVGSYNLYTSPYINNTYTYDSEQTITIDHTGKVIVGEEKKTDQRSNNKATRYVEDNAEELANTMEGWVGGGGVTFTSEDIRAGNTGPNRKGKSGEADVQEENIDLLMAVIGAAGSAATSQPAKSFLEGVKQILDAGTIGNDLGGKDAFDIKDRTKTDSCRFCGSTGTADEMKDHIDVVPMKPKK